MTTFPFLLPLDRRSSCYVTGHVILGTRHAYPHSASTFTMNRKHDTTTRRHIHVDTVDTTRAFPLPNAESRLPANTYHQSDQASDVGSECDPYSAGGSTSRQRRVEERTM